MNSAPQSSVQLSPAAEESWLEISAKEHGRLKFESQRRDLDELDTLDIATVASYLNWAPAKVSKHFPVIELGPRSRRIRRSDYIAFLEKNTRQPKKS